MTRDVFLIGFIGGLGAVVGLICFVVLSIAVYVAITRAVIAIEAAREERSARREDLTTCRAIEALGITNHPKE